MHATASIVVRTYNESTWLDLLLRSIASQEFPRENIEILVVDSGSTDNTLDIAKHHGCKILTIKREDFTFGRSLNVGCSAARGDVLVFISGHCLPIDHAWLSSLIHAVERTDYVYGRQVGHKISKFSEHQVFAKYFPASKADAQGGAFCNNANAALRRSVWAAHRFDEDLTGLEDMELAKRLVAAGLTIDYVPEAVVSHIHCESWAQIRLRYEREALALQRIMPEVRLGMGDFLRFFLSAILHDCGEALAQRRFLRLFSEIVMFRLMQYWGAYRGGNDRRSLSRRLKEQYFYPK